MTAHTKEKHEMQQQTSEGEMRRSPGGVEYEALLESPRAVVLRVTPDGDELNVTILPSGGGTVIASTAGDIVDFLIHAWHIITTEPPGSGGGKKCGDVHVSVGGGSGTGGSGTGGTGGSGTGTGTGGGVGGGGAGAGAGTGGSGGTGGQGYGGAIEGVNITINYNCK